MSLFMPKQQYHHQQQTFNRIDLTNSSSVNRIQQFNLIMSTEETKQLAGLVAKTRALFEKNNNRVTLTQDQHHEQPIKQKNTSLVLNRPMRSVPTNENDSDKENSTSKQETLAPFLNQLKPTSKLASKFQNLFNQSNTNTNNLHLPNLTPQQQQPVKLNNKWIINNQHYKSATPLYSSSSCSASSASSSPPPSSLSCHSFESTDINDCVNIVSSNSPSSLWQASEQISKEYNLPTSVRQAKMCFERNAQQQSRTFSATTSNKTKLNESPIYLSSASSSVSSVPSSPTSSLDNSTHFKAVIANQRDDKCAYPFNQTKPNQVHLPNLLPQQQQQQQQQLVPQVTSNNKIKILKKNFSKNNTITNNELKEIKEIKTKYTPNYQQFNQQTDEVYDSNVTSTASIQIKTFKIKQPEPVVTIKSILRNKTPVEHTLPIEHRDVSPKLNEKYVEHFNEKINENAVKVDQSSCVLPSKIKTNIFNEQTVLKSTTNNFKSWQPKNEFITNNIVKNNPFTANNNINNSNTTNVIKRPNRSAATAKENLLRWCRKHTQEYSNVSIENFSSSWSNGLAFCALINHFIPEAFDYELLDPINARRNFELAFKTAEEMAGIVSLLDVDDMIEMGNSPDWKCVFTYVHSIYQKFKETA